METNDQHTYQETTTTEYGQSEELCFDDILLLPRYSELDSRKSPSLSVILGGILKLDLPLVSAAMDSITGKRMLVAMDRQGGVGILSRYINLDHNKEISRQKNEIRWAIDKGAKNIGCAIGIRNDPFNTANELLDTGCNVICIDVAHADHRKVYETLTILEKLRGRYSFVLMAGNICTSTAAHKMIEHGVNTIKVGIGPGAVCTTRAVTGFGRPQLSAIQDCVSATCGYNVSIIADGGLRTTGDCIKSLWAGASACMMGYMLAGTDCAPDIDGHKIYRGMSSRSASGRSDIASEGVEFPVKYKGSTNEKLIEYAKGMKSGLAMAGAMDIEGLRQCDFVRVSPLCTVESRPKQG